ncbi:MAG: succinylglutamate desuccinylase/aspartoacylase family protein [Planctomycetota bacterium]
MLRTALRGVMLCLMASGFGADTSFGQHLAVAPRLESGMLGAGHPWQTPYYISDSGVDGPTVLITGGVHGNEPAGAAAAEQIRHWPITRGRLIVVPRVNQLGLDQNTRFIPNAPDEQKDLNRNFPRSKESSQRPRGEIARSLWNFVMAQDPQWVFDLHEGYEFNRSHQPKAGKDKSVGSSVIYAKDETLHPLAQSMQQAVNENVANPDRRFVLLGRGPKVTTLANATRTVLGKKAMILETTYNFQRLPTRTRQHRTMMSVALRHLGMIGVDCVDLVAASRSHDPDAQVVVGIYDDSGCSEGGANNIAAALRQKPGTRVVRLGSHDMRLQVLDQLDVMVFGGGSGSKQAASIRKEGAEALRSFVAAGGGYVGICGGAYLCSAHYPWSLNLVDTHVFTGTRVVEGKGPQPMWVRGETTRVDVQLTDQGRRVFADFPERIQIKYHNGPIVSPRLFPGLARYEALAFFRSEQVLHPPQEGTMIDTPAIVRGVFGEGHVISISPHPEATEGLEPMVVAAVRAVTPSQHGD